MNTAAAAAVVAGEAVANDGGGVASYLNPFSYGNSLFYMFSILKLSVTIYMFHKAKMPVWMARYFGRVFHMVTFPVVQAAQMAGLRGNLLDRVDDNVYIGAMPMYWDVDTALAHNNVRAVVNLCDEYAGPVATYARYGIKQLYLPVVDHYEPSVAELRSAITFIEQQVAERNSVFVHCKAGRGRSGAVVICWIAYSKNMSLEQAQKYLIERRNKVRKGLYRQKNIMAFYAKYCNGNSN
eukprot:gene4083-4756_t